jgi:NADH-quinone oxidoreductase subunit N
LQSTIRTPQSDPLRAVRSFTAKLIAFFAIITCTFGNLAAYGQNNLKRLLAYSTIAHAGYMMMPVAAAVAMTGIDNAGAESAIAALAIYMAVYLFMNLAAFAVVALLRNAMRSEDLTDYGGLIRRAPLTVVCFAATLFSLIGLPPLSGFIGKFAIFAALVDGYQKVESAGFPGFYLLLLLIVGGVNTVISLFYYLRVVKVMTIDEEPRDRPTLAYSDVSLGGAYLWLITLPTVLLIVSWEWLSQISLAAARYLLT